MTPSELQAENERLQRVCEALASTDSLAWLNEQIAAELEAVQKMVEIEEELSGDPPAEISQYFTDTPTAVRCLRTAVRGTKRSISAQLQRRIAELRRKEG